MEHPRVSPDNFFFQAEAGIRDGRVTGVQTCALPIFRPRSSERRTVSDPNVRRSLLRGLTMSRDPQLAEKTLALKIGRASCRERVRIFGAGVDEDGQTVGRPANNYSSGLSSVLLCSGA